MIRALRALVRLMYGRAIRALVRLHLANKDTAR